MNCWENRLALRAPRLWPSLPLNVVEHTVFTREPGIIDIVLFKKMCDARSTTMGIDLTNPVEVHYATLALCSLFAPGDYPIDTVQIRPQVKGFKERFSRDETDRG